jgi:hypothetical protein
MAHAVDGCFPGPSGVPSLEHKAHGLLSCISNTVTMPKLTIERKWRVSAVPAQPSAGAFCAAGALSASSPDGNRRDRDPYVRASSTS